MASVFDYINALDMWRDKLAANLTTMGVTADSSEKLNTLVPKVLQIPQSGGGSSTAVFDADHQSGIYLQHNGTVYSLADFVALYPDFCSSSNAYALNYSNTLLGWDVGIYTCSTTPISVTSATQIAMRFLCGSTETGIMRLVRSDTGTAEDILTKAQTEGSYIDLPLQWIYAADYVTTLTPCDGVTAGSYYLVWVGRSNNSQPKIQSVTAIS
ncbi:hypothetical protein [Ruminococcus sp.]|uniref:hypothetical protein n=1 Tax=Ruminococcus sp. TaxID=41978 RepID=UPI0025E557AB|nr:hypothetical protein [Ruminococcus sp.]